MHIKITSIFFSTFPQLRDAGGFEILLSKKSSRNIIHVVSQGSCNAGILRSFGTGRIYVRPLQLSIPLRKGSDIQFETCLVCHDNIPVSRMRKHYDDVHVSFNALTIQFISIFIKHMYKSLSNM